MGILDRGLIVLNLRCALAGALFLYLCGCDSAAHYHSGSDINSLENVEIWGTCDHTKHADPDSRTCREWTGIFWGAEDLEQSCTKISNGAFSKSPCTKNQLIGVCVVDGGLSSEIIFYYYAGDWTLSKAADNCADKNLKQRELGDTVSEWFPL